MELKAQLLFVLVVAEGLVREDLLCRLGQLAERLVLKVLLDAVSLEAPAEVFPILSLAREGLQRREP